MTKLISIAIDAMGGENAPDKTIEGVSLFLKKNNKNKDFLLNLFGNEIKIKEELKKHNISSDQIKITHTDRIVSDEETPLTSIKN